ncbi:anti-sigma factor antagonist [Geitlerinema sp. P-1104]|uniref:STAS domain-containing protein n=1 Tax=Geitlerinema sp. P-1104 TaxID=2546230 RepID=UPI0014776AB9|nr:STAS domain-containing protein [Geitlerinema sp. P-1104]NMG57586.1 anti-sigma factor antagonist [Geitlerinema sp. P-1104]
MAIVLRPHGKLNAHGAAKLKRKLGQLLTTVAANQKTWIVDLADVHHIDRNGLVSLIELRRQAEGACCTFLLRDVSESVQMTLDAAHLSDGFRIQSQRNPSTRRRSSPKPRPLRRSPRPEPMTTWQNSPHHAETSREFEVSDADVDSEIEISQIPQVTAADGMVQPPAVSTSDPLYLNVTVNERQWTTWRQ